MSKIVVGRNGKYYSGMFCGAMGVAVYAGLRLLSEAIFTTAPAELQIPISQEGE
jgi:hypothetical protein